MYLGPRKDCPEATLHTLAHPFRRPALPSHEVHVWRAELQQPHWALCRLAESLPADEHRRTQAYRMEKQQIRFVAARGILRDGHAWISTQAPALSAPLLRRELRTESTTEVGMPTNGSGPNRERFLPVVRLHADE